LEVIEDGPKGSSGAFAAMSDDPLLGPGQDAEAV
jgi:hypothetical protein